MTREADVVVLGGGPAGLAAATALARRGRDVVVLERADYLSVRAGETFASELRPLLQELGAWEAFAALPQVPYRGVRSAWGPGGVAERSSIDRPLGDGFHVERARFDRMLAEAAAQAGVELHRRAGHCAVVRDAGSFRVSPASGPEVRARFLLDASGRGASASAAAFRERRWLSFDRLVAVTARFPARQEPAAELLIEAVEEGWFYVVPQPDGTLLVALMTDADLVPAGARADLAERFLSAVRRTGQVAPLVAGEVPLSEPRIVRADSGLLLPDRGPGWRALGDAAFACDPLGGDGVVRALRSGLLAAREVCEGTGERPASPVSRFETYLDRRASYYSIETRWPGALFWERRRAAEWASVPISLDPLCRLRWHGGRAGRHTVAAAEALLPRAAISLLAQELQTPRPAHEVLAALRDEFPLADRRLLAGVQLLVSRGCVAAA